MDCAENALEGCGTHVSEICTKTLRRPHIHAGVFSAMCGVVLLYGAALVMVRAEPETGWFFAVERGDSADHDEDGKVPLPRHSPAPDEPQVEGRIEVVTTAAPKQKMPKKQGPDKHTSQRLKWLAQHLGGRQQNSPGDVEAKKPVPVNEAQLSDSGEDENEAGSSELSFISGLWAQSDDPAPVAASGAEEVSDFDKSEEASSSESPSH